MSAKNFKIWIVSPCFFDTASFIKVRENTITSLSTVFPHLELRFILIDDSARQDGEVQNLSAYPDIQIVYPPYNLGHQSALVFALRGLGGTVQEDDFVVTMDSDGEDRPEDLTALLKPLLDRNENLHQVAIASRTRRTESLPFKLFYLCFKATFLALTGTVIRNGNFAAFRGWFLKEVIFHTHFDQCYSSSFISLSIQITPVPLPRGQRYLGKSKMGYMGLFTHGIRMLMPFSEKIATRGMVFSLLIVGASLIALLSSIAFTSMRIEFPLFGLYLGTLTLGISVILFATFSQSKAQGLRGMHALPRN